MGEKLHEKYIFTDISTKVDEIGTLMFNLDEKVVPDIPFFTESAWVWPKKEKIVMESKPHSHDFVEVVTLFGSNPDNPKDLCGEVEFWMDNVKCTIMNSCIIYVPKGIVHCPLIFHKVERPIFHYIVGQASKYSA